MPYYRRVRRPGGTYFLTVVTQNRAPIFAMEPARAMLRGAIDRCRAFHPFSLDAIVLLPDHLHLLITLPPGDDDYPGRLANFKSGFSRACLAAGGTEQARSVSQVRQRARGVWLKRYWEHTIRDQDDLKNHYDYICYNPVKHKLASCPHAWAHSSFQRLVEQKRYRDTRCCRCADRESGPIPPVIDSPAFETIARLSGE